MGKDATIAGKSWIAWVGIGALLLIWVAGLRNAIVGGLNSGYVRNPSEQPYPVEGVLIVCSIISIEFGILMMILRPFSFLWRRIFIAFAVFGSLLLADLLLGSAATDLPGYCYSNFFFLSLAIGFLLFATFFKTISSLLAD